MNAGAARAVGVKHKVLACAQQRSAAGEGVFVRQTGIVRQSHAG